MSRPYLAILALLLAAPALATNTSRKATLRVTLHDGSVVEGDLSWKDQKLEVRGRARKRIAYRDISEISAPPLPTDEELKQEVEARKQKAKALDDWIKLARWAEERGLEDAAADAWEQARALDAERKEVREGLGELQDEGGQWVAAGVVLSGRRAKLKPGDKDGLVDLATYAFEHGQRSAGFDLLVEVLVQDTYFARALKLIRAHTDDYRQATKLCFPLAGRWKASEDKGRHHQLKAYATYALDLNKVDGEGRLCRGKGKQLEDYFAWGEPFYAVADGTVVEVREGNPDNPIGQIGDAFEKHNGVSLDHGNGELSWYVHAKKGSIKVKLGDRVKRGQLLGEVGNSGGSAIPHLHFTLISFRRISVPWRCEAFELIAPDGTPIRVRDAWPREGWTIQTKPPAAAPAGTEERKN
ncbi:MAG: peptidoglycan DD-metalloendopeptidase family protein [Planctomycetota bacterium]